MQNKISINKDINVAKSMPSLFYERSSYFTSTINNIFLNSWQFIIDENSNNTGFYNWPSNSQDCDFTIIIKGQPPVGHSMVMFRTKEVITLGGYNHDFKFGQDIDLWLRVIEKYKVANINKVLYHRKVSKQSITIQTKKQQLQFAEIAKKCYLARISNKKEPLYLLNNINQHNISQKPSIKIINSNYYFYCGRIYFSKRKMISSRLYLLKSIFHNPFKILNIIYYILSFLPISILNILEQYWKTIQQKYKIQI